MVSQDLSLAKKSQQALGPSKSEQYKNSDGEISSASPKHGKHINNYISGWILYFDYVDK